MKYILCLLCALITGCSSSKSLIKENSIDGWKTVNGGQWSVENGILSGSKAAEISKHCLLVSEAEFSDFKLDLEYMAINGNSGFYFRLEPAENPVGFKGYHAEIDSKGSNSGGLFDVAVKWITKPDPELVKKAFKNKQWNHMVIEANGPEITVTLNGHKMSSIVGERTFKGHLGIQLHSNENTQIKFRNISITEL